MRSLRESQGRLQRQRLWALQMAALSMDNDRPVAPQTLPCPHQAHLAAPFAQHGLRPLQQPPCAPLQRLRPLTAPDKHDATPAPTTSSAARTMAPGNNQPGLAATDATTSSIQTARLDMENQASENATTDDLPPATTCSTTRTMATAPTMSSTTRTAALAMDNNAPESATSATTRTMALNADNSEPATSDDLPVATTCSTTRIVAHSNKQPVPSSATWTAALPGHGQQRARVCYKCYHKDNGPQCGQQRACYL